jgi:uncharacterized protein DUF4082
MTDYDLRSAFGSGPAASQNDGSTQYTLGVAWDATTGPVWLKGYAFWRPADGGSPLVTGPVTARTWQSVAGTAVPGSDATFTLSGSGWQQVLLATPVPLSTGVNYRSGLHFPNGRYPVTVEYWGSGPGGTGHTSGPLRALNRSAALDGKQGVLNVGAALAFPNTGSSNSSSFWVTPILTDVDPAGSTPSGSISAPVGVSATITGAKVASGAVSAAVAVASGLSGAHEGVGAATAPVTVSAAVSGQNPSSAPYSALLCSPWATVADIPSAVRDKLDLTDAQWATPLMVASELLFMLSGRRWYGGGCTEQAQLRSVPPGPGTGTWPYHDSWRHCGCWARADWVNGYPVAPYLGPWSHPTVMAVRLPRAPVTDVLSVTVGGQPFTAYNLLRSGWIERTDGRGWNVCSGDTTVTYAYGEPPPLGGVQAAITLGIELAKDMYGVGGCRLPKRITSITRQGITTDFADSMDVLREGGTGIASIDMWLHAVNPGARPQRAAVWSPDVPRLAIRRNS